MSESGGTAILYLLIALGFVTIAGAFLYSLGKVGTPYLLRLLHLSSSQSLSVYHHLYGDPEDLVFTAPAELPTLEQRSPSDQIMRARSTNAEGDPGGTNPVMRMLEDRRRRFSFAEPMVSCEVIGSTRDMLQLRTALASNSCPNEFVEIGGATEEEHILIGGVHILPHYSVDQGHVSGDDNGLTYDLTALPV